MVRSAMDQKKVKLIASVALFAILFSIILINFSLIKNIEVIKGASSYLMSSYIFTTIFANIEPILNFFTNLSFLYFAIYIVMPIILTIVIAIAFNGAEFFKWTKEGFGVNIG